MKNIYLALLIFIFISGCSDKKLKSIELTKDNFSILDSLKLTKTYLKINAKGYGYEYYFNDPKKIEVIKLCIKTYAEQIPSAIEQVHQGRNDKMQVYGLYFETLKEVYCTRIAWDDDYVYGDWWRSKELRKVFKKWELDNEISKADPAWPEPNLVRQPETNEFKPVQFDKNEP